MNFDQGADGLHEFTLLWCLGAHADEITPVSTPMSDTEAFHSGIYDSDVPTAVVVLRLGQPNAALVREGIGGVGFSIGRAIVEDG